MRILILTPFYLPDQGPSAALYATLAEELVSLGCEVTVICAVPHYPSGRVSQEFRGKLIQREDRNGVRVIRVWTPSVNRASLSMRGMQFAAYQVLATVAGSRQKYDAMIASNPAFEVFFAFLFLGIFRRKPTVFSVHEIYPEIGVKLGIFRYQTVIKIVDALERFCYRKARTIRVLSEGYKKALVKKGVDASKLHAIGDWVDTDFVQPLPRRNPFSNRWGLDDCFVVMYAGNIGPTQGLENVVEAARALKEESSIRFVFVGEGSSKDQLQKYVRESDLKNIQFISLQPREQLPFVLASADVSLLTLKPGMGRDSVPSKCNSILASGRPIIASVDPNSDTWILIQTSQSGFCIEPENPLALADAISDLYGKPLKRALLARNGRAYAVRYCSRATAAREFYDLLQRLGPSKLQPQAKVAAHG